LADEGDVHLLDRLGVVFRYRRVVITVLAVVVIGAIVQTFTTVPLYRATARVQIEEDRPSVTGFQDAPSAYPDPEVYKNTQYSILRGRDLTRKVVRKLDLAHSGAFSAAQRQPGGVRALLGSLRGRLAAAVNALLARPAAPEPPLPNENAGESALIDGFLAGVQVTPEPASQLVNVSYVFTSPQFAALAANAVAEAYVEQNLELKQQATRKTLDWLANQITEQERKVQESQQALASYREQHDALSLGDVNVVANRLSYFNDQASRARALRVQKETLYNQIKSVRADDPAADTFPAIGQNGSIQRIKAELQGYEQQRRDLSQRYGEKHPEMQKLATAIEDARARLRAEVGKVVESVRQDYQNAVQDEQRLAAQYARAEREATDLNRKSIDYSVLENQAKTNQDIYQRLLQQQQQMQVASNSKENNVRLADRAEVPALPFTPNAPRNLVLALAIGLALGLGLAFGLDYLDDTVKTPEDITRRLNVPFLGMVPAVRGHKEAVLSGPVPHDFGEAYRALRTSLVFTSGGESTRIIAITSAQPLEGKTTTACNLAIVLALGGARVLLIDADMRRPAVQRVLGLENGIGLSHLLTGQARVREAIQRIDDPSLYVVTAGRTPPNPSELLASERMKRLVQNLATGPFDWVIIDTPPVLAVTDAVVLTPLVSGVTLVLGAEMTRRRLAERAVQMLTLSKPRVMGAVLNRVNFDRNKYYYSRYYGYQYKSYYGQAAVKA
jgi:capsular exopolysaccharide synthesis family protein